MMMNYHLQLYLLLLLIISLLKYNDYLSIVSYDPGSLLLLDYFRNGSLPPHSLLILISLISTSTKPTDVLDSTIANIHFADNINLYEQIRTAQWKDLSILPLLNFLQNQITPTIGNLPKFYGLARLHRVIDGALYRIFRNKYLSEHLLLVIPSSEVTNILQLAHDHAIATHLRRRKTLSILNSRFYWPRMHRDIADYVRACILCMRYLVRLRI
ncbi:unnamed protein product [Rotaria magnacalcarata]|uniref:Integrase zinc-binding domain-containing protein n=2 Tax=Rotaria magnacalcarata TaxID=392030 RepID=A0A816KWH5_9BILA|nr:unnamed protein product [Rotaria magnacalcarata]CAF2115077.1 unnamed protein product [Rotaria magnacalcarata]